SILNHIVSHLTAGVPGNMPGCPERSSTPNLTAVSLSPVAPLCNPAMGAQVHHPPDLTHAGVHGIEAFPGGIDKGIGLDRIDCLDREGNGEHVTYEHVIQ